MGLISAVLDLPQLYQKPSGTDLVKALALLSLQPRTFGTTADVVKGPAVQPAGVTRYLTSIIASQLAWLETDELREAIWDAAAARLSERSGRTGKQVTICLAVFCYPADRDSFSTSYAGNVSNLQRAHLLRRRIYTNSPRTVNHGGQPRYEDLGIFVSSLAPASQHWIATSTCSLGIGYSLHLEPETSAGTRAWCWNRLGRAFLCGSAR